MIGSGIKKVRQVRGLKQSELARFCGVGSHQISRVESGRLNPSIRLLDRAARSLGVPVWVLWFVADAGETVHESMVNGIIQQIYLKNAKK